MCETIFYFYTDKESGYTKLTVTVIIYTLFILNIFVYTYMQYTTSVLLQ